jgi:hypothetical protein
MTADPFTSAAPSGRKGPGTGVDSRDAEAKRDSYGRYLIPPPPADMLAQFAAQGYAKPTKGETAWTRATTFAKSISDTFVLSAWSQRMAVKGLAMRPDLVALAAATRVDDKKTLDDIVDQAKDAAAVRARANLGTAVHGFTEMHDRGEDLSGIPAPYDEDVAAWAAALANHGLVPEPELIERAVVNTRWHTAGTFDRVVRLVLPDGRVAYLVLDLKTGRDLTYGWNEIAIQLVIYATADAIWDWTRKVFLPLPKGLRTDQAVVVHLPAGTGKAEVYQVDLREAADAADLCKAVRAWRTTRNLATLLSKVETGDAELVDLSPDQGESAHDAVQAQNALGIEAGPALELGHQTCPACGEPAAVVGVDSTDWSCKSCMSWGTDYGQEVAKRLWEAQEETTGTSTQERTTDALGGPLGPLAGPGERGCSVCRRKGHKKGSPKCLGDEDPASMAAIVQGTLDRAEAKKVCAHTDGWSTNPDGSTFCPTCGAPGAAVAADSKDGPAVLEDFTVVTVTEDGSTVEDGGDPFADAPMPAAKAKPVKARPPTDLERVQAAASEGELLKIGRELAAAGKLTDEIKTAAKVRRAKLAEPAG